MYNFRNVLLKLLPFYLLISSGLAYAQSFPSKPIHIVTSGVGGGADFAARLIGQGLTLSLGQPVIVDNRGSGSTPGEIVAKAAPDGHTLLLFGATVWLLPFMRNNVPYDPVRDFAPITLAVSSPNVLTVHPSLPVRSVKDLIALAKARPGQLNYSTSGVGSGPHLAGELFKSMAGINMVHIPYKGGGEATTALLTGEVQLTFSALSAVAGPVKAGRLRTLAVGSAQPSTLMPDLPTIASSGLPGFESVAMNVVFAPGKTPETVVIQLNQEIARILHRPESKELFFKNGAEVVASSPAEISAKIKSEMAVMGKIIKDAGIRDE